MEDRRQEVGVIVAGYPSEMQRFLSSNPGLASRLPKTLTFDDYDDDELFSIFELTARQHGFEVGPGVEQRVRALIRSPPDRRGHRTLVAADLPTEAPPDDPKLQGMYL